MKRPDAPVVIIDTANVATTPCLSHTRTHDVTDIIL